MLSKSEERYEYTCPRSLMNSKQDNLRDQVAEIQRQFETARKNWFISIRAPQ